MHRRMGAATAMAALAATAVLLTVAPIAPAGSSTAPTSNPCRVLQRSEIKKEFGGDVGAASHNDGLCAWDLGGGIGKKGGGTVSVELDTSSGAAQNFEGFATDREAIPGIGDRAFYGPDSSFGFNILKGGAYLRVAATFGLLGKQPNEARVRAKLTRLTKIAVKRI